MPLCLRVSGICSLAVDVGKRGLPRQDRHNEKHIVLTLISSKIRLLTVRVAFYMGRMTEVTEELHILLTAIIKHRRKHTICSYKEEKC